VVKKRYPVRTIHVKKRLYEKEIPQLSEDEITPSAETIALMIYDILNLCTCVCVCGWARMCAHVQSKSEQFQIKFWNKCELN
jgi:hypothetical protein